MTYLKKKRKQLMIRGAKLAMVAGASLTLLGCDGGGPSLGDAFASLSDAFRGTFNNIF